VKATSDGARLNVTAEVDWGRSVVDLVRQDGQLVINPLSNREPMQLLEEWLRWRWSGALQNYTCRSVLHALQLLNTAGWSSVQHSVAAVQPRQYRAARQSECQFQRYPQELVKLRHRQCHPRVRTGKSSLCHVFQYDQFEYRSTVGSLRHSRASTIDSIFFTLDVGMGTSNSGSRRLWLPLHLEMTSICFSYSTCTLIETSVKLSHGSYPGNCGICRKT